MFLPGGNGATVAAESAVRHAVKSQLLISEIKVQARHRKDLGDIESLAESIRVNGLLHPVVITPGKVLVAGYRRLEACKLLKWKWVPVRSIDVKNLLLAEHDENELRKDFTPSERVAIVQAMNPQKVGGDRKSDQKQNLANDRPTIDDAAKAAGFGNRETYRQARTVVANGAPELVEAMDKGEVSPSAASEVARLPRNEQREVLKQGPAAVAEKAKEIRENLPPKPPPKYPHSERLERWLKAVSSETHIINVELGGIAKVLAESEKWHWGTVRSFILPMLEALGRTIAEFHQEIESASQQRREREPARAG